MISRHVAFKLYDFVSFRTRFLIKPYFHFSVDFKMEMLNLIITVNLIPAQLSVC